MIQPASPAWIVAQAPARADIAGMIMATQGLAEYVALNATRAGTAMRFAFHNAWEVASDHFLVVVGVMVAIVLLYTFSLSKPR